MTKRQLFFYVFFDFIASLIVWLLFYLYRRVTNDFFFSPVPNPSLILPSYSLALSAMYFPVISLAVHYLSGAYIITSRRFRLRELFTTLVATFVISVVIYFTMLVDDEVVSYEFYYQSFLILWSLLFLFTYLFRAVQTWRQMGFFHLSNITLDKKKFDSIDIMPAWQWAFKRAFDVISSIAVLLLLSPFFLIIAVIIKLDSEGAIFYTQERIGKNAKPFRIIKFRTMCRDAELSGPALTAENDSRITRIGGFLRRYRVDELPQFINILKGEMSVVGPRPERPFFIERITEVAPRYSELYKVQPGLLSWGPIKVGYSDTIGKMVRRLDYDIEYINNMSLSTDIKIIILSFSVVMLGKGR
ncbi:MAG: sugar transferase [Paludibacteraceae bacterium]|nr:sugar transferase [Paludibacteraceae bacterium]